MPNTKKVVQEGDTLLMDKSKVPSKYIEVPEMVVNKAIGLKPREKKPLSEKQKENLQRLIELNKKRREEKIAAARVNVEELGEIPEDKVLVKVVKGAGKSGRPRNPPKQKNQVESEHEVVDEEPQLPPPMPKATREKKQVARRPLSEPEEELEPSPPKRKAAPKPVVRKPVARKPRSYYSETSETSGVDGGSESESESDEETVKRRVSKYVQKTKDRMEALRQIEAQLKPTSKYSGMSIF